ncbi:MAG: outer membrane beta-barrel protein [Bacteriovoracaceae bacterium]|nr:outer membrane beta-barrel protein [Bacteriovoracaceae bacterium]
MKHGVTVFLMLVLTAVPCRLCRAVELEVTPLVGYTFGESFEEGYTGTDLDLEEGISLGAAIDFPLDQGRQVEFYYSRQATELEAGGGIPTDEVLFDIDVHYIQIGGTYTWRDEGELRPFIVGTLGVTHFDPEPSGLSSRTRFSLGLGGGAKAYITERFGLRLEGRGFATLIDDDGGDSVIFSDPGGLSVVVSSDIFAQFVFNFGVFFRF